MQVQTVVVSESDLRSLTNGNGIAIADTGFSILDTGTYIDNATIGNGDKQFFQPQNAFGVLQSTGSDQIAVETLTINVTQPDDFENASSSSASELVKDVEKLNENIIGYASTNDESESQHNIIAANLIQQELISDAIQSKRTSQIKLESTLIDGTVSNLILENQSSNVDSINAVFHELLTEDGSNLIDKQQQQIFDEVSNDTDGNTVVIDVSNPIELCQNSLIVVEGQKCVLQHNSETGQLIAFPIKEPEKPKKRRGRPRKQHEMNLADGGTEDQSSKSEDQPTVNDHKENPNVEESGEKGFVETATEEGNIVKRSARKRKMTTMLNEYETELKLEFGDDRDDDDKAQSGRRNRIVKRRTLKSQANVAVTQPTLSLEPSVKRGRGRPRRYGVKPPIQEATQTFLVQNHDESGQAVVLHLPISNLPPGVTMELIAQGIADSLNSQQEGVQNSLPPLAQKISSSTSIAEADSQHDKTSFQIVNEVVAELPQSEIPTDLPAGTEENPSSMSEATNKQNNNNNCDDELTNVTINEQICEEGNSFVKDSLNNENAEKLPVETVLEIGHSEIDLDARRAIEETTTAPTTVIPLSLILSAKDSPVRIGLKASEIDIEKLKCSKCGFQGYYQQQHQEHLATHVGDVQKCKCCAFLSFEDDDMIQHFKEHHPKCICSICNYTTEHPYLQKKHQERHIASNFTCAICKKSYKDQYILKMHVQLVHLPAKELYGCNECDKKFSRKAHLKRHLRTHDPNKPHKCTLCDYTGCERSDITKHMLIHEEPKHFCEVCGKTFRHIKNKELHVKRHNGQRDFKCGDCDFYGYTYTDIRKHIERKHADLKQILCRRCGQLFRTESERKKHQASGNCDLFTLEQVLQDQDAAEIDQNLIVNSREDDLREIKPVIESKDSEDSEAVASITITDGSFATLNGIPSQIIVSGEMKPIGKSKLGSQRVEVLPSQKEDEAGNTLILTSTPQLDSEALTIVTDSKGNNHVAVITENGHMVSEVIVNAYDEHDQLQLSAGNSNIDINS